MHTAKAQGVVQQATIQSAEAALPVARANLVMIQAQLAQKQAALDTAKVNLDHTYIRAPVDGTAVLRNDRCRADGGRQLAIAADINPSRRTCGRCRLTARSTRPMWAG